MSLQVSKFPILKCLGLSVGAALLLGNTSAMASVQQANAPLRTSSYTVDIAQAGSSSTRDVVVDTVPAGTSTPRTSTGGSSIPVPRTSTGGSSRTVSDSQTRFSCELVNDQYTVMYQPESQPNQSFPWATPAALGDGWTSERRCDEISQRLEAYRPDGLIELRTDVENDYNTVCVTTENDPNCRIVFTVPPGQDPTSTRNRVFQNLTVADSGEQTTAVTTYVNRGRQGNEVDRLLDRGRAVLGGEKNPQVGSGSINLRPFLDQADGGTATRLEGGVPRQSNSQLNPGRFR